MKKVILICPDQRETLLHVVDTSPLALAIYIGKPLLDHALYGFKQLGVEEALIIASDYPAEIRNFVRDGSAWGIRITMLAQPAEPDPEQARTLHPEFQDAEVWTLDNLPQAPEIRILDTPQSWHTSRDALLPLLAHQQVGTHEIAPGIWLGLKAKVSSSAILHPPCWIGHHATISNDAVVGPHGYVENDSLIDANASVEHSTVGDKTYLGQLTYLSHSIACGPELINWRNASRIQLTDTFLLSRLENPPIPTTPLRARLLALVVVLLTSPVVLLAIVLSKLTHKPWLARNQAVLPAEPGRPLPTITYHLLPALPGKWQHWPILLRIVTGHFSWIGNPPLSSAEAGILENEFERLWISIPPGLFTAPEAEGCHPPWDDDAKAHAALFATKPNFSWRMSILRKGMIALTGIRKHTNHENPNH